MKSRFLRTVTKTIAIPALTFLVMCAQIAPNIFQGCTNQEFIELLNSLPSQIMIVEAATHIEDTKGLEELDKKNSYSSDYTYVYSGSDKKLYKTMYGLSNNKMVRQALLDYLDTELLDMWEGKYHSVESTTSYIIMANMYGLTDMLTSKAGRKALGKLAEENTDWIKASWAASTELIKSKATGIVNSDYDVVHYKNGSKINRYEWYAMFGRYENTNANLSRFEKTLAREGSKDAQILNDKVSDKNEKYKIYILNYEETGNKYLVSFMDINNPERAFAEADMEKNVTKLEVIYTLGGRMTSDPYNKPYVGKTDKEMAKELIEAFSDLTSANFAYNSGMSGKDILSKKKLDSQATSYIYACYKLGVLIPDADGNANLFKSITYSQALRYLFNDTIAWNKYLFRDK